MDGLTLEKAVKICRAYEQSNTQVKEFRGNSNPSGSATRVNKVFQKPGPRVPRSNKSECDKRKTVKVGKLNVISVVTNTRESKKNVLHGERHVTSVKVEIISSPNTCSVTLSR